jgi:hypothetical protein
VTRGCLKLLTRDELQGVIAHEFSHILNGDTRLNMQLIGLAHGLFWPTILGRILIYGTTDGSPADDNFVIEDGRPKILPTAVFGFIFIILGSTSLPFVRLTKSAICRQREWLADAAAVQFTRNPAGITGALKKIGGLFKQGRLDTPHAEVASHLYFADSNYAPWFSFFATHPPVAKRITAIDPSFNGVFERVKMLRPNQYELDQAFDTALGTILAAGGSLSSRAIALDSPATNEHLRQAALMRLGLSAEIHAALRTPAGAAGVLFALLLSDDDSVRAGQLALLQRNLIPEFYQAATALIPQVQALGDRCKFTLAELAVPALRNTTPDAHNAFNQTLQQLVGQEGSIGLFEYTLLKMVSRQLSSHFSGPNLAPVRGGRVADLLPECALLLSAIAHVGQENEADARAAFAKGVECLDIRNEQPPFLTRSQWNLAQVDAALTKLAGYHEPLRRNVLLACIQTAVANGQVNEREAELLRAIADTFNCPIPPFVDSYRTEEIATNS